MSETQTCPECGTTLPATAPRGLCPACLLKRGLETHTVGFTETIPTPPARWMPPSVEELSPLFPELEILRLLGRGGMGAVYQARQKSLDRVVALKILPPDLGHDAAGGAFAERFTREAQAMARLNHPHIVTIYEFGQRSGQSSGQWPVVSGQNAADSMGEPPAVPPLATDHRPLTTFFFLMEFVDGASLRTLLDSGHITPKEALAIVPQICDALQYAHDQGIVHRDIKPENILLNKQGQVKIADFGLAKLMGRNSGQGPVVGGQNLETTSAGTPQYMAPEQVERPAEVDHRADIYSLGVVFYQMLTGELPVGRFALPSKTVHVDVRLDQVVLRALEHSPELRFQNATQFKTEVETVISTTAAEPSHPGGADPQFSIPKSDNVPASGRQPVPDFVFQIRDLLNRMRFTYILIPLAVQFIALAALFVGNKLPWREFADIWLPWTAIMLAFAAMTFSIFFGILRWHRPPAAALMAFLYLVVGLWVLNDTSSGGDPMSIIPVVIQMLFLLLYAGILILSLIVDLRPPGPQRTPEPAQTTPAPPAPQPISTTAAINGPRVLFLFILLLGATLLGNQLRPHPLSPVWPLILTCLIVGFSEVLRHRWRSSRPTLFNPASATPSGIPPSEISNLKAEAPHDDQLRRAQQDLRIPAIGLRVAAMINLLLTLVLLIGIAFILIVTYVPAAVTPTHRTSGVGIKSPILMGFVVAYVVFNIFLLQRASAMAKLRDYSSAVVAAILGMLAVPGNLIGLPMGIWALIFLTHSDVKEAFAVVERQRKTRGSNPQPPSATPPETAPPKGVMSIGMDLAFDRGPQKQPLKLDSRPPASTDPLPPSLLITFALHTLVVFGTFFFFVLVVPHFSVLFEQFHASLPAATQWVLELSYALKNFWAFLCFFFALTADLAILWSLHHFGLPRLRRAWSLLVLVSLAAIVLPSLFALQLPFRSLTSSTVPTPLPTRTTPRWQPTFGPVIEIPLTRAEATPAGLLFVSLSDARKVAPPPFSVKFTTTVWVTVGTKPNMDKTDGFSFIELTPELKTWAAANHVEMVLCFEKDRWDWQTLQTKIRDGTGDSPIPFDATPDQALHLLASPRKNWEDPQVNEIQDHSYVPHVAIWFSFQAHPVAVFQTPNNTSGILQLTADAATQSLTLRVKRMVSTETTTGHLPL